MLNRVVFINVGAWRRVFLLVPVLLALVGAWYGVRWMAGSTLAERAPDIGTAEAAARLAPHDPQAHLRVARLRRASFLPEEMPKSLADYERAAARSPHDYLIWMEWGRALASTGEPDRGVGALRRAVELAPNYAEPRWHLGNALLRAGRTEDAFVEMRRAAEIDPTKRPQVFNLAWQLYDQNVARVIEVVGRTPDARAQLIGVLVGRGLLEEATALWSGLSGEERRSNSQAGDALARALLGKGQFRRALQVLKETGTTEASAGEVENGGFESDIAPPGREPFGWLVPPSPTGVQVAIDARTARAGSRSLRVAFSASGQVEFKHVAQLVVVESSARYSLSFFVRTDDLKSTATLQVEVLDAATGSVIASTPPAPVGTNDWQQFTADFTTSPSAEAVVVRLARAGCADAACPIYGKIWYDDFHLKPSGGR